MERSLSTAISVMDAAQTGETEGKYLTFITDGQLFAVPISYVVQIVGMQEITAIPDYPPYAKGVINLRGVVVPVIDVRLRLGRPEAPYNERTCVIVSNINDLYFGFIVDGVDEVTDIPESLVSPPPQMGGDAANRYLTGIARLENRKSETIVLLIDTGKILGDDEYETLAQGAQ